VLIDRKQKKSPKNYTFFWQAKLKYLRLIIVSNFTKIVKQYLGDLPQNADPALDTFTFVSGWLSFSLDQSLRTMRELFFLFNISA